MEWKMRKTYYEVVTNRNDVIFDENGKFRNEEK
jgi:hypothetical protein